MYACVENLISFDSTFMNAWVTILIFFDSTLNALTFQCVKSLWIFNLMNFSNLDGLCLVDFQEYFFFIWDFQILIISYFWVLICYNDLGGNVVPQKENSTGQNEFGVWHFEKWTTHANFRRSVVPWRLNSIGWS